MIEEWKMHQHPLNYFHRLSYSLWAIYQAALTMQYGVSVELIGLMELILDRRMDAYDTRNEAFIYVFSIFCFLLNISLQFSPRQWTVVKLNKSYDLAG